MAKQILSSLEARNKIKKGMNQLADIVKATLGPKGRNIIIEKEWGEADVIQDGVTVARSIDLKDRFENVGAQLVKSASIKTNDSAGDGTTTAIVLAQAMIEEGMKYSELGVSALGIRKGIKRATKAITEELDKLSIEVKNKTQMKQIATISAKDEEIGTIVSDVMDKVGKAGVVNVEKGQTNIIEQEIVEGFRFAKGFVSPYMVTDRNKGISEILEPYIVITDKAISDVGAILPIMEKLATINVKQLVFVCGEIGGDALITLVVNNAKGSYRSLAIKAPYYGDKQKAALEDIAILTGGTLISQELGVELKDIDISHLGRAKKISSTKDFTTIIEGKGDRAKVDERIAEITKLIEEEKSDYLKEILRERLGRLSGVVGIIKVGANSETEQRDLELRLEDAISATQASLEEGIVIGGGLALIKAKHNVLENKRVFTSPEELKGWEIVMNAIEKPFYQIMINAGEKPDVILETLKNSKTDGYNADTGEYVDMVKAGIIDPKKVVRCALENASSVAEMFLSTEGIICMEDVKPQAII
jgi:chaperonin GroEL